VTENVDANEEAEEANDEEDTAVLPTVDDGIQEVTAEVPEPSVDNITTTTNAVEESTPENVTAASSDVDVVMTKLVSEQPQSATPEADKENEVLADQVVIGETAEDVQPPVHSETVTEEKKKKKKTKKKRQEEDADVVNEIVKEDEMKSDVATVETKSKDDQSQPIDVGFSGDQIDKPDLLSNSTDGGNEQDVAKAKPESKPAEGSSAVQPTVAEAAEPNSSSVVEQSMPVDGTETSSVPAAPKEKKKKKQQ